MKKSNLLSAIFLILLLNSCSKKNSILIPPTDSSILGTIITDTQPVTIETNPTPPKRVPSRVSNHPIHQNRSIYGTTTFKLKTKLSKKVKESSGLIKVDGRLWTMNDSGGRAELYQIDEQNGRVLKRVKIINAHNRDWEALTFDDNYIYIGDVGNNRGYRRDLRIYKIPRGALKNQKSIRAEVINFNYSDQKDFTKKASRQTNFDCEAMVAYHGKLYLFSKDWGDNRTRLYELSTSVGKQIAKYKSSFNINGLVTDASINRELDILLLSTYSSILTADIWAFSNFKGENFFNGDKKKLNIKPTTAQIEGITFIGSHKAYVSSEAFRKYIFSFDASLYSLDFSGEFE